VEANRRTLGDILYGGTSRAALSEKDWADLVRSIAAGDQAALRTIYEQTHRIVYTLVVRLTNNRETADEVTLDVFHDVWRKAAAYDPADGSVVGWIMNQARSRAIDRVRFDLRKKRVSVSPDNPLEPPVSPDPLQAADVEQRRRILRQALTVLTPEERQTIEAAFFSELTYPEVATRFGQPLGTVKTRIRSGLSKLRAALGSGQNP
jgi:RNA polymerase sigma-70 factor, ECF subfamily